MVTSHKVLLITEDGLCMIHDTRDRLDDVDHEIDDETYDELSSDYIVYVNDGTPAVIKQRLISRYLIVDANPEEIRSRARRIEEGG